MTIIRRIAHGIRNAIERIRAALATLTPSRVLAILRLPSWQRHRLPRRWITKHTTHRPGLTIRDTRHYPKD